MIRIYVLYFVHSLICLSCSLCKKSMDINGNYLSYHDSTANQFTFKNPFYLYLVLDGRECCEYHAMRVLLWEHLLQVEGLKLLIRLESFQLFSIFQDLSFQIIYLFSCFVFRNIHCRYVEQLNKLHFLLHWDVFSEIVALFFKQ